MANSAVPGAISELLQILRAANDLEDLQIIDGPPTQDIATVDFLAVGWSGGEDQGAESVQDFNAAGARTRDEDFTVASVIDVWSGDDGFSVVRDRAYAILGIVEQAIRATGPNPDAPNLNGTVLWAHLTRTQLRQYFTDQGARVALVFTVSCHARI